MEIKEFNENEMLKEEYEDMVNDDYQEPQSEIGKAISSIEKQAFEHAVENDTNTDDDNGDAVSEDSDGSEKETRDNESVQQSSVYIGVVGAVTKLQEELKKAKSKEFAEPVIEYLIERCKDSESLASDICQDHKTWEKCYQYIFEAARKKLSGKSGPVRSDVVFEWAEDYYRKDDKAEEEKKDKEAKRKTKEPKPAAIQENKTDVSKTKTEPNPKKSSKDMDGQLDMFSLLGM